MRPKSGQEPENYYDYVVYPLEGVWDINEKTKNNSEGKLDKKSLVYKLIIRQPAFVTAGFAAGIIEMTKKKKPHELLDSVKFEEVEE